MPGGSRRPRRKTRSVYAVRGTEDEALEETPLEETRTRSRRSATRQLFASDDVQDAVQDEDAVQHEDEDEDAVQHEDEDEDAVQHEDEAGSSQSSKVYQRGITRLPSAPIAADHRPVIRPEGDKSWKLVGGVRSRHPNSMLGLLIKKHYPGLVTRDDGTKAVPWHWPDFFTVRDEYEVPIGIKIKREFWEWFMCEQGYEVQASAMQDKVAKGRLKDMYYEAHVQVLITYYADVLRQRLPKEQARKMILDPDTDI